MNIVVCVKQVPETAEAEIKLAPDKKGIVKEGLPLQINEADNYALEQALLLTEEHDGDVTVVTLGPDSSDEVLRMSMAKGAADAVRLGDPAFDRGDAVATAEALAAAISGMEYDLVLTGCMSSDDGNTAVGVALAQCLGVPHATYVTQMEVGDGEITVGRELRPSREAQDEAPLRHRHPDRHQRAALRVDNGHREGGEARDRDEVPVGRRVGRRGSG